MPPTKIDRRVPRDLETIVLKALAKRPADRYATAGELFEDLERFLNREPVKARRIGLIGRAWRIARRHPGITAVSTAAAAIVLAIATFAYLRSRLGAKPGRQGTGQDRAGPRPREGAQPQAAGHAQGPAAKDYRAGGDFRCAEPSQSMALSESRKRRALEPEADHRTELRDSAVNFLVLREIEAVTPDLATGRSHGLLFTPSGHRLAVLSEDEDELAFWDVAERRRLTRLSLRGGAGSVPRVIPELPTGEIAEGRSEPAGGPTAATAPGSSSVRQPNQTGPGGPGRPNLFGQPRNRLAQIGPYIASVLPDDKGLGLDRLALRIAAAGTGPSRS